MKFGIEFVPQIPLDELALTTTTTKTYTKP